MCCRHQIVSVPHEVRSTSVPVLCAVLSTCLLYYIILYILILQIMASAILQNHSFYTIGLGVYNDLYINKFLKYLHNIPYRLIVQQ